MVATQLFLSLYRIKIRRNIRIKYWIWGTYAPLGLWAGFSRFFYFGTRSQIPMHFRNLYPLLNFFIHMWLCSLYREVTQTQGREKKRTEKRNYLRPAEVNGVPQYKPKTSQYSPFWFSTKKRILWNYFFCPSGMYIVLLNYAIGELQVGIFFLIWENKTQTYTLQIPNALAMDTKEMDRLKISQVHLN